MKKIALIAIGLFCVGLLGACSGQGMESSNKSETKQTAKTGGSEQAGKKVQDFSLKGVDGKTYKLSDFKGKKVYLKFWASWCSICLASLPDTDEIAKEAGDDYVVLTVVSPGHKGEQAEAEFKNWYKGLDYKNIPVLIQGIVTENPSGKLLESYGVRSYPTQAFIDKEGKLVKTQPGFMDKDMILKELKEMG